MPGIFDAFSNQYALSKTLRFELKPVGKTLENMRDHLRYDKSLQTFMADQEIEDAYQILKPVFDLLHEEFITDSLESTIAQKIDFSQYLEQYKRKEDLKNLESSLRTALGKTYDEVAIQWKNRIGKNEKGKEFVSEKGYKILTEKGIFDYLQKAVDRFSHIHSPEVIAKALKAFEGFSTYFSGFNQNRENYYETKKEASTAIVTRIVHDNLPKFCDNILLFENRAEDYKKMYTVLQELGRDLVNKKGEALHPVSENIFQISHFNSCLSQKQIEKYNEEIGNANFLINLYNQAKKDQKEFKKIPLFKTLYKQIGCGKREATFFALTQDKKNTNEAQPGTSGKTIDSVEEVLEIAQKAGKKYFQGKTDDGFINTVPEFLDDLRSRENYAGIYWSKAAINTISNKYFDNWHELKDRLKKAKIFSKASKESEEKVKIPDVVELEGLFSVINETENWKVALFKKAVMEEQPKKNIIEKSQTPSKALLELIFADIEEYARLFLEEGGKITTLKEYKSEKSKEDIKTWMDHARSISQILKYFLVKESKTKGKSLDSTVAEALKLILQSEDAKWFSWHDALRNYLTKKPQDETKENKLKLNFENSTLAGGWDLNKEPDNYCIILRNSEGKEFLAIIAKSKEKRFNRIFEKNEKNPLYKIDKGENWEKMEYKLLPGPNKMLPKCLLPKSDRKKYGATEEILTLYDKGEFKKGSTFSVQSLHKLIDFYKAALLKYEDWKVFNFIFKKTVEYEDISQFYSDVEKQGYKLDFIPVNKSVIDQWIEEGKIYLFEIKNQDANKGKAVGHRNNLHTLYWKALFENISNKPKLNGEAEVFYRKALADKELQKNKDKHGKEIIKNFRFSKEKFLFHVPITLNFCLKNEKINDLVKNHISPSSNVHFFGIDRGEKHLAYYSLVDRDGNLVEQGTLNLPFKDKNGNPRTIKVKNQQGKEIGCKDYNDLLAVRAGDRDFARKNWQTIGTIKELKAGYISQIVRTIADLAVRHNTFIVLEDLNTGFKRGRQKIEKSVYQKFELALAKKLNFLVDKAAKNGEIGSVTRALQLTPPVANYGDIENRKQVGIMLYTRAHYTSQTDPVTGWRKNIYLKKGSEADIKRQIVDNFSEIRFDGKDYYFEYTDRNTGKIWRLYSGSNGKSLDRFRGSRGKDKNEWKIDRQNIVKILDGVFANCDKNRSLLAQIIDENVQLNKFDEHTAWESLRFAIELNQQIRNTGTEERDDDFILSPVRDENGKHFDSREYWDKEQKGQKAEWPTCGDANGAYNIARKGIIMNEHIKRGYSLLIKDEEWDAWLAGKETWTKWLQEHEKDLKEKKNGGGKK